MNNEKLVIEGKYQILKEKKSMSNNYDYERSWRMKPRIIIKLIAIGIFIGLTSCWGQTNKYLSTFEFVWKKVNDSFYDSTFCGFSWKDAHDRYLPKVTAIENDQDFYKLVNSMLWELKVSHTNLIPPGNLAFSEPLVCSEGSPGFDVRLIDGNAVITSVKQGSPAGEAGLRPGYLISAIDEIPIEEIIKETRKNLRPPDNSSNKNAVITKSILGRIYGSAGSEVSIACSDAAGQKIERRLTRIKRNGRAVGPNGILYLAVDFEARVLDNRIGYIRLNTFQQPLAPMISNSIKSMGNLSGIVFDLRGNAGGEIEEMPDLFLNERTLLFLRRSRNGETKVFFDPAENAYKGPLVLLIDQLSGSACELFAGCLQAAGRAVVIGERTPGAALESDMEILPNGSILMHPIAQPVIPDGTVLEGHGVIPDIEVKLDREMLLKGVDSQVDAAIRYLGNKGLK